MPLVVALVAPFVEELLYRGLGYGLLTQFISVAARDPDHRASPSGSATGSCSGCRCSRSSASPSRWLRWQTGSVYPGMVVHGIFNGLALARGGARVSEQFDEIRRQITANDEAIVAAVNHRLELVDRAVGAEGRARARHRRPRPRAAPARDARRRQRRPALGRGPRPPRDRAARPDEEGARRVALRASSPRR